MNDLLNDAARYASEYLEGLRERRVYPGVEILSEISTLGGELPNEPTDPSKVLALLNAVGSPATVATAGGRYFGYVIGGVLPSALAANWLASAWDQNAFARTTSPIAAAVEEIALRWLVEIFRLPADCGVGFVTGATMASFTALAAARHSILANAGWDVEERGLFDAPPISVVAGEEIHVSVLKALSMLGLGRQGIQRVPVDAQGRMRVDQLPQLNPSTIVCIQAGNVNTGAFDPAGEICARARDGGAWVHVDGAFGLWAAAAPSLARLTEGISDADSWATDGHKWLNVPYDSGLAFVRNPDHLRAAMALQASYFVASEQRDPGQFTPDASRRARGIEIWAALRSLGRRGLTDLIERCCRHARRFADVLESEGFSILNDVVLNQVLVAFGDSDRTRRVIKAIQDDGTCWCGGTQWQHHMAMRISVSSWATTEEDVERSLEAMIRIARQ
ncbi:MAG: pyridoxal phosphate-dependent decarboxylase family protein [Candidatus Binataceae bacterium]